jgi:two-component system, chemotaxis family, response regulator Rcp1
MTRPLRILLVEDDDRDAKLTLRAFGKLSELSIERAVSGEEALDRLLKINGYARQSSPDLVLLDLNLPGIDGHAVLQRAKADPVARSIPMVALTSSKADADVLRSWDLQVAGYLRKPIKLDDFRMLADKLVRWWSCNELPHR